MAESTQAPGRLALVQDFVNSRDLEEQRDDIGTPDALAGWLAEHGLGGGPLDGDDVDRAVSLREVIRRLCLANNGGEVSEQDLFELNQAAWRAQLRPRFLPGGDCDLVPEAGGVESPLGELVAAVYQAMAVGTWSQLKACRDDTCLWAFYDHSRSHSRSWCSMGSCGNRAKARRFRARRRGGGGDAP